MLRDAGWHVLGRDGSMSWRGDGSAEELTAIFAKVFNPVFHHGPFVPPPLRIPIFIRWVPPALRGEEASRSLFEVADYFSGFWKQHAVKLIEHEDRGEVLRQRAMKRNGEEYERLRAEVAARMPPHVLKEYDGDDEE